MMAQPRTFKVKHGLISTFEEDPICDPVEVVPVETRNPKYAVLYPALIERQLRRNPVPLECRVEDSVRGFPIRSPVQAYPWCPYLPAVVSYHYRIFSGMAAVPTPKPDRDGPHFRLDGGLISKWAAVERVMRDTIEHIGGPKHTGPNFQLPVYPSEYGYRNAHRQRKPAVDAIKNSLHSFHQLLAYCSYLLATVRSSSFPLRDCEVSFNDANKVQGLPEAPEDHHTLTLLLWSSLGEIHRARNFVGVIITPLGSWDHGHLRSMEAYGIPIYVHWPDPSHMEGYLSQNNDGPLTRWCPPITAFTESQHPTAFTESQHPTTFGERATPNHPPPANHPPPPICLALNRQSKEYPWEYVKKRKDEIGKLTLDPSDVARQKYAESFAVPGTKGAAVYEFEFCQKADQTRGKEVKEWRRVRLTKHEVSIRWGDFKPSQLWWVTFASFFSSLFQPAT